MNNNSIVKLEALDIEIPVRRFSYYHDDGPVSSIVDHAEEISRRHKCAEISKNERERLAGLTGVTTPVPVRIGDIKVGNRYYIYYKPTGNDALDLLVRAHEETHVVDYTDNLLLLTNKLRLDVGVLMDLRIFRDHPEFIADIGAIYALDKRGIDYNIEILDERETHQIAMEAYNEAKTN